MNGTEFSDMFRRYFKARLPLITIRTLERNRALDLIRQVTVSLNVSTYVHTMTNGTFEISSKKAVNDDRSIVGAVDFAGQQMLQRQNLTFILTEVEDLENETSFARQLLDAVVVASERGGTICILTSKPVWNQLQRHGMAIELSSPDEDEMVDVIRDQIEPYRPSLRIEWDEDDLRRAATTLAGVTRIEAENVIATLLAKGSILKDDFAELSRAKDSIFSDISGIERVEVRPNSLQVGGLAALRAWLTRKKPLLTADLRERGIRPPRGVLLVGVPGCGKSLSAKQISHEFGVPLYRMDFANLMGMYVGQSEGRLREALQAADRVAPCVLWIDEIEKGLGTSNDGTGVTNRLIGQFLFWLQEAPARVFVVATANDVSKLPPELLRRGRFDELFFVDLPTPEERAEIISLYCRRGLGRVPDPGLMEELIATSEGFAGADLEAAVRDVVEEAFLSGDAQVTDQLFRRSFENIVPLSKTSPERIEAIRTWGRERAVPASGASIGTSLTTGARRAVLV
jgi:ATPase family associated with various cellular activities (AAA)